MIAIIPTDIIQNIHKRRLQLSNTYQISRLNDPNHGFAGLASGHQVAAIGRHRRLDVGFVAVGSGVGDDESGLIGGDVQQSNEVVSSMHQDPIGLIFADGVIGEDGGNEGDFIDGDIADVFMRKLRSFANEAFACFHEFPDMNETQ